MEKTAPIAVYTSGKGSSAAGLTASVIRDSSTVSPILAACFCSKICSNSVCYDIFIQFTHYLCCSASSILKVGLWFWLMEGLCVLMNLTR